MIYFGFGIETKHIVDTPLEDALSFSTVAEIKDIIRELMLPVKLSGKKQELVDSVTDYLRSHPEHLLRFMSAFQIETAKRLMDGEIIVGNIDVILEFHVLAQLGWVCLRDSRECPDAVEMIMTNEARDLLRPLLEGLEIPLSKRVARFAEGWAALCGDVTITEVCNRLSREPEFEGITYDNVHRYLMDESPLLVNWNDWYNHGEGDYVYTSQWWRIVGKPASVIVKDIERDGKTVKAASYEPKDFTMAEIMAASQTLFAPPTPNHAAIKKLEKTLRTLGLNDIRINQFILDCWKGKQLDNESFGPQPMLGKLPLRSLNDANLALGAMSEYFNTVPYWRFRGSSSEEEFIERNKTATRAPHIVAGPNMCAMGLDIPEGFQDEIDKAWAAAHSANSVGRNDPCPCGSGKKFKHCCGK